MKVQERKRIVASMDETAQGILLESAFRAHEFCWRYLSSPLREATVHHVGPWHDPLGAPLPAQGPHLILRRLIVDVSNAVAALDGYAEAQGWLRIRP